MKAISNLSFAELRLHLAIRKRAFIALVCTNLRFALTLLVLTLSTASLHAQYETLEKPTKPQKQTTTTTTKPTKPTKPQKPTTGTINGHEWVDLGLSVKWATCNVGASSPSDYGNYYAWGETSPKSEYTEENSKTFGKSMGSIAGNSQYDTARANWGSTWRLPTKEEIDELVDKCTWTWTSQGGHNGYKVKGPNGNSIFLPAAGWRDGTSLNLAASTATIGVPRPTRAMRTTRTTSTSTVAITTGTGTTATTGGPCAPCQNKSEACLIHSIHLIHWFWAS